MNTTIIMRLRVHKDDHKEFAKIIEDIGKLGWEYTSGRMSRSGMYYYDKIAVALGLMDKGEHWNEDVYQDHNCDH